MEEKDFRRLLTDQTEEIKRHVEMIVIPSLDVININIYTELAINYFL